MTSPVVGWQAGRSSDPNSGSADEIRVAQECLAVLLTKYPGWSWFVEVRDGLVMIKCYELDWRGRWQMVRKYADLARDAGHLVREVTRAAGEFLERASMVRGARKNDDDVAKTLDGADKYTPMPSGLLVPGA